MMKLYFSLIIIFLSLSLLQVQVYGIDEIMKKNILITKSNFMKEVNFDGKWTFYQEWKQTTWNQVRSNENIVFHLRTAHQENFIYVLIDVISDTTKNVGLDKATVCIDSKNNKSKFFDSDDYCFIVQLEDRNIIDMLFNKQNNFVIQGNPYSDSFEELEIIKVKEFIGVGTMSDKEDKYSEISHASYEFKIPIELVERSDNYGFYVNVFDADSNTTYSWPEDIKLKSFDIPKPLLWGNLISPDKSLLENSESESGNIYILLAIILVILAMISFIILKKRIILKKEKKKRQSSFS